MQIFVTGGTGFIGSHFLNAALSAGHDVVALRRAENSYPRISLQNEPHWISKSFLEVTAEDFAGCDCLVHFVSAGVSPQKATWAELFDVNLVQSLNLWIKAIDAGVLRFVICGSCFEYGKSGELYEFIPVDAPLMPNNGYGASKASASIAALALAKERSLKLAILRPFHAYGEGQHKSNFWPSLRHAALCSEDFLMTAGEQVRDFQLVQDIAEKFLYFAECADLKPGIPIVKNLGSGKPEMLKDFAARWWAHFNGQGVLRIGSLPYRKNEVMRYVPEVF
jgi:nucleoside-diphosphate-sugar epimerase